ncbi:hypothetical protein ACH44C_33905 [Streptomyces purpureus]|uniref:hypothetical protein n=1 Tax=Streptomyces purpureus TaxID=1951 RepID=UPI0037B08D36
MHAMPRRAAVLASALALLTGFTGAAEVSAAAPATAPATAPEAPSPDEYAASCITTIEGSRVTASCHNPFPRTDRVRLHVECERWWDIDTDSAPVDVLPADHVQLTQRCWKEVRAAWVTHLPQPGS